MDPKIKQRIVKYWIMRETDTSSPKVVQTKPKLIDKRERKSKRFKATLIFSTHALNTFSLVSS